MRPPECPQRQAHEQGAWWWCPAVPIFRRASSGLCGRRSPNLLDCAPRLASRYCLRGTRGTVSDQSHHCRNAKCFFPFPSPPPPGTQLSSRSGASGLSTCSKTHPCHGERTPRAQCQGPSGGRPCRQGAAPDRTWGHSHWGLEPRLCQVLLQPWSGRGRL